MKKGFILLEILIGLTFLGIVAAASLPVLTYSNRSMEIAVEKVEMFYLCDYISQTLKTDEVEVIEILEEMIEDGSVLYQGSEIVAGTYTCNLYLLEMEGEYLLFEIILKSNKYDNMEVRLEVSRQMQWVLID